ncbi:MAG: type II toxin-antitoxin system RelE/ParE family toxin [Rhodothermaceae bacterium]|nr:type II toxin-antitoxin system RelE/ParE family toxin [Rhodothermaceae bacterium]
MIRSFGDDETANVFYGRVSTRLPASIQKSALRKLRLIDTATLLQDLRIPPGNRLERLKGDRLGQHSIRINQKWRICFEWENGDAYYVQINNHYAR